MSSGWILGLHALALGDYRFAPVPAAIFGLRLADWLLVAGALVAAAAAVASWRSAILQARANREASRARLWIKTTRTGLDAEQDRIGFTVGNLGAGPALNPWVIVVGPTKWAAVRIGDIGVLPGGYSATRRTAIVERKNADAVNAVITWHDDHGFPHALSTALVDKRFDTWSWRRQRHVPRNPYPRVKDMASCVLGDTVDKDSRRSMPVLNSARMMKL